MKASERRFDPAFKARVTLGAVEEGKSLAQLGQRFGLRLEVTRPDQVWAADITHIPLAYG